MLHHRKRQVERTLINYTGVLEYIDRFNESLRFDKNEPIPDGWRKDPLVLLGGYLLLLNLTEEEKALHRPAWERIVGQKGREYVWTNRLHLAAEIEYQRHQD